MKSFVRKNAPTLYRLLQIVGGGRFEMLPPRVKYALPPLHGEIAKRFGFKGGVYFEVGANDGITQSNTAYLDKYLNWSGILVEAVPHKFVECTQNRPKAATFHAALVPTDYDLPYIEIVYSNLMSISSLSLLNENDHTAKGREFLDQDRAILQQRFLAPTRTASSVIEEAGDPIIDLFSIDVEGAEQSVLEGIDFSRHRPRHFLIELREPAATVEFLNSHGYEFVAKLSRHDYLFRDAISGSLA